MFGVMKLDDLNVGFLWDNDSAQLTIDSVAPADRKNGARPVVLAGVSYAFAGIDIFVSRQWPKG